MTAADILPAGALLARRFKIQRHVARRSAADVYRAIAVENDAPVAIKTLREDFAVLDTSSERFAREADVMTRLDHPGIPRLVGSGRSVGGHPFIAMEWLEGETLEARIRREGRVALRDLLRWLEPVCRTVDHAHQANVVHRDISPSNIFLSDRGPKLIDFGTSLRPGETRLTARHVVLGTPSYLAPERLMFEGLDDHRGDLWSLGVVVFTALTGRPPFQGTTFEVARQVVSSHPPRPSVRVPSLGPAVDRVMLRALRRDPDARYQSAMEFCSALLHAHHTHAGSGYPVATASRSLAFRLPEPSRDVWLGAATRVSSTADGWRAWGRMATCALGFVSRPCSGWSQVATTSIRQRTQRPTRRR